MSYLLDTNVVSELTRPKPNARVVDWFRSVPDDSLHLSVLSLGEIRSGVERLAGGAKRERLRLWLERDLPEWFEDRLLTVGPEIADRWGRLVADAEGPVSAVDALLAATALEHRLRLVTRNVADFRFPGLDLVDPWRS